jgi:hypothetical protein
MFSFSFLKRSRRRYASRLPLGRARTAQLSARIHEDARLALNALALERGMSTSEYVARLLNDHLHGTANLQFVLDKYRKER